MQTQTTAYDAFRTVHGDLVHFMLKKSSKTITAWQVIHRCEVLLCCVKYVTHF